MKPISTFDWTCACGLELWTSSPIFPDYDYDLIVMLPTKIMFLVTQKSSPGNVFVCLKIASESEKGNCIRTKCEQKDPKLMRSFIWCNKSRFGEAKQHRKEIKLSFQLVHGCILSSNVF